MNPVHFMLGIVACCYDKTFEEIYKAMQDGFKDTVFEELPKQMIAQCIIKLVVDGMVEMSGENKFDDKTIEEVVNMLLNGDLADRKFRIMKKQ